MKCRFAILTSALVSIQFVSGCGAGNAGSGSPIAESVFVPAITAQPASQSVTAGQTAMFNVTASNTAPLSYQWQKNGAAISGATPPSYTTPATTAADNGSQYAVVVSNSAGSITSATATLTVNPAPNPVPSVT
jgi:beta-galactosidase